MKRKNLIYALVFITLLLLSLLIKYNSQLLVKFIKDTLTSGILIWLITVIIFILKLLSKIKFGKISLSNIKNPNEFKESIAEIISSLIDPSTFICSISILKALFLDCFYSDTYFQKFEASDKIFIFIITLYFSIVALTELMKNFKELFITETVEIEE